MNASDWDKYTDKYGLVHPSPPPGYSQNGIRFTAEKVLGMLRQGIWNESERAKVEAAFLTCEPVAGLLSRHPESNEQQGPDDYYSRLAVDNLVTGGRFARNFLYYGRHPKNEWGLPFVFNNVDETKIDVHSFIGRQQPIIALAQYVAGEPVPLWRKITVWFSLLHSAFRADQDGKVLCWFLIIGYEQSGKPDPFTDFLVWVWKKMLGKHFPGGIGHVLEAYYGPHPNSLALMGEGLT